MPLTERSSSSWAVWSERHDTVTPKPYRTTSEDSVYPPRVFFPSETSVYPPRFFVVVSISLLISSSSRRRPPPFTFPDVEFVALAIMTYWVPDVRNLAQVGRAA